MARGRGRENAWEALWYGVPTWRTRLCAIVLAPAAWLFGVGVRLRNFAFELGLFRATRIPGATVVSVGNVVVGGSGKTPVVAFLARWAVACGRRVAVLSRGYGRRSQETVCFTSSDLPDVDVVGDEPLLLARTCPGVEIWVGARRAEVALQARNRGADFLILDDGFQHRWLSRDVDVVVVTGLEGHAGMLPAGPLREPGSGLRRASLLWVPASVEWQSGSLPSVRAEHRLIDVRAPDGRCVEPASLKGQKVVLLTGIARPRRVERDLEALGAQVVARHCYTDHHHFTAAEVERATLEAERWGAKVVTTEKDAQRLPEGFGVWVLRQDVVVTDGFELLGQQMGLDPARIPGGRSLWIR